MKSHVPICPTLQRQAQKGVIHFFQLILNSVLCLGQVYCLPPEHPAFRAFLVVV